jgi:hypothetical protein
VAHRDEKGRFIKGNNANPSGRPPKEREVKYYDLLLTTVSEAEWVEIICTAARQAKRGDASARKWLTEYLVGVPAQKMEFTGKDGSKLAIHLSWEEADE